METAKKILVTGASGSLGQQLLYEFTRRGCRPIAHVRESSDTSYIDSLGLEKRYADLRNDEQIAALVEGIDGIIHTAAWVSRRQDRLTQFTAINTWGARNLFQAAQKAGVERFVHVSTVAATAALPRKNGENGRAMGPRERVNEDMSFNLGHLRIPYFMTKHAAEVELLKLAKEGTTELVIVNPSIIVAPSPTGDNRGETLKWFPRWVMPGFHNRINLVDIRDVAPAIISALERGRANERYILAGDSVTMRELVLNISQALGRVPHVMHIPRTMFEFAARFWVIWAKLTGRGKISFYPDLVKLLDYDWAFSSMKARRELGFSNRSVWVTVDDLLHNRFNGTYLKPGVEEKKEGAG